MMLYKDILNRLNNENHLVLTPNNRLSVFLKEKLQQEQLKQENFRHNIYPLAEWIASLWKSLQEQGQQKKDQNKELKKISEKKIILTDFQLELVWEGIITKSKIGEGLFKASGAVKRAITAMKLCNTYDISLANIQYYSENNVDFKAFVEWTSAYREICVKNNWIDYSASLNVIINAVKNRKITLPHSISLIEFNEINPKYQELFDALIEQNIVVTLDAITEQTKSCCRVKVLNETEELKRAALFAKEQTSNNKNNSVAIIVPKLELIKSEVITEFNKVFNETEYNVSLANSLQEYSLIETAFSILHLSKKQIDFNTLSYILRSPYIKLNNFDKFELIELELFLRNFKQQSFMWQDLLDKINTFISKKHTEYSAGFLKYFTIYNKFKYVKQSLEQWVLVFKELLEALNWSQGRSLTATEKAALVKWDELLSEFVELAFITKEVSFAKALNILHKQAANTLVPRSTPINTKVQVLGILEAIGIPFDAVWVMGMDGNAWPFPPNPNPFIPLPLQIAKNIPRSSVKRELEVAKNLMGSLQKAARTTTIFSCAEFIGDVAVKPSKLITNFAEKNIAEVININSVNGINNVNSMNVIEVLESNSLSLVKEKATETKMETAKKKSTEKEKSIESETEIKINTETLIDTVSVDKNVGPVVKQIEKFNQGVKILKLQAECPFRAFGEIRLRARPLEEPLEHVSKAEKGEVFHQILANFWKEIKTSDNLHKLADLALENMLTTIIDDVLHKWQKKNFKKLKENYLKLEKIRLLKLLSEWLVIEKQRSPFEIHSVEQSQHVTIGPIEFKVRLDRIDKLKDYNTYALIDYKTANIELKSWFDERLSEPQLPLYAVVSDLKISTVTFAIITASNKTFKGISSINDAISGSGSGSRVLMLDKIPHKGKQSNFQEQLSFWRNSLAKLAEDFFQGVAVVSPKDGAITCRYCHLKPLCRIEM